MEAKLLSELDRMTDTLHETVVAVQTQIDALEELKRAAVRTLPHTQTPNPTQTKPGQPPQSTSFWLLFGPTV